MNATTDNYKRLTHDDVRRACGAAGSAMEMTCPCCGHGHLQLFGRDAFDCKNGCANETVAEELRRRRDSGEAPAVAAKSKPKKLKPSQLPSWQGFTLSDYCKLKGLDARVLKHYFDAREISFKGKPVIGWPYYGEDEKLLAMKLRLSADSHDTLFNPADPHIPYGLNNPNLQNLIAGTYDLFITEGESDCQTLACYSYLVIGISGAEGWLPEYADLPIIERARRVFVCEDQDAGGRTFVAKVLRTLPQAFVLRPEGVNDISELHLKYKDFDADENPWIQHPFVQSIDIAIQAATLEKAMRQPKAAKPRPIMDDAAFYGLAGELVELLEPVLETDRASILSNVLALTGVMFQRAAYYKVTADAHYPANYYLTVGNSAVSRKGTTTNAVLEIIERAQGGFKDKILHGLSTGQGLIAALIKKRPEGEEEDEGVEAPLPEPIAPSVLVEISEFAELLAVMKRDENTLSAVMRDAWDGKTMAVTTRHDPLKVQNVSLSTLAHITRRELMDRLTSTDRANGFANRFLFVWTQRVKLLPNGDMSHVDANAVVTKLHAALAAAQGAGGLKRDYEAETIWEEEYKRLSTRGDTMTDALLSRAEAHVVRLSLLYALLDSSRTIRKEHLLAALAFWDYCEASVRYVFGDAADPDFAKILRKLENGPLSSSEIRRNVFGDNKTAEWVDEKLLALEQLRKVRRGPKQMKTKVVEAWHLVEYQP